MRRYAIFLFAIPAALVCARFGIWQLSRLQQRRASNAVLHAAMTQEPIQLNSRQQTYQPFRAVAASGRFDYDRQVVVEGAPIEGAPGVIVVTPLRLGDSTAVLVERGWVFSPDGQTVDLGRTRESDSTTVSGVIVDPGAEAGTVPGAEWPKRVQRPSPNVLGPLYPYKLLPYVVRRTDPPALSALRPVPLPELSDGPHLGYAFQWFAFAIIAVVGSVFIYRKEVRRVGRV